VRILFTGASSFTGYWFVRELAAAGHEVVAPLRREPASYDGVRARRVGRLGQHAELIVGPSFGDPAFLELISNAERWDALCHHAADVTDYKSEDFDVAAALANNTRSARDVLCALVAKGCQRVVLTGSVFEPNEGAGSGGLQAFSPYGLSKALTAETFRYHAARAGVSLGKFVIPNPFGPYEEPRFTSYLMRTWYAGQVAAVQTPAYVRDNIHVSLLAKAYARFIEQLPDEAGLRRYAPSGYPESQGAFSLRFAAALRTRLDLPCEVSLKKQTSFPEPQVRINTDIPDAGALGWDEELAWDELADYYRTALAT
jgi:nucleoside-diphosphate-sugar epimerase